jgi:hypothetical protein
MKDLRLVTQRIALKVAQTARNEGCGRTLDDGALQVAIEQFSWFPEYSA